MGEYAVLQGKSALVCAIDKRITVSLRSRTDNQLTIHSSLGNYLGDIFNITPVQPFQFVLSALKQFELKTGCDITIESEFSSEMGLGSSAAVTVATLAALKKWDNADLIREARAIIQNVQGLGSGADVSASVLGGVVHYQMEPLFIEKLAADFPISVIYSGYKTPTAEVVKKVKASLDDAAFNEICYEIDGYVQSAIKALKEKNYLALGQCMNLQQKAMVKLGVNTVELDQIIQTLNQETSILGAKISGSGLGDCVIALGESESLDIAISKQGLTYE